MPTFTIDIPQKAVDKLKALVDRTNANEGASYTVRDWLLLHIKELAIADDLAASGAALRRQAEQDARDAFEAAARATRDALLADLDIAG